MTLSSILQMIMTIISMILQFIVGGIPPLQTTSHRQPTIAVTNYDNFCTHPLWNQAPTVASGQFSGSIVISCIIESTGNGNLEDLRNYLKGEVASSATKTVRAPATVTSKGVEHDVFEGVFPYYSEQGQSKSVQGTSDLWLSNSRLVSSFTAKPGAWYSASSSLKNMVSSVEIKPTGNPNEYAIQLTTSTQIAQPWGISATDFKNLVVQKTEARMEQDRDRLLSLIAEHL